MGGNLPWPPTVACLKAKTLQVLKPCFPISVIISRCLMLLCVSDHTYLYWSRC